MKMKKFQTVLILLTMTVFAAHIHAQNKSVNRRANNNNSVNKPANNSNSNSANKKLVTTQTSKQKNLPNIVREGKGIEGISVGVSSMDDVEKKFGKSYKLIPHKKYSYQMSYGALGLSFYACQSDPKKQIFVIEIKQPYKAKTSRGIILGSSTVEDIQKAYGKLKEGLAYRGIDFYYNTIGGKKIVTEIDVVENTGIRQCVASK
jgi:hypothetical protein